MKNKFAVNFFSQLSTSLEKGIVKGLVGFMPLNGFDFSFFRGSYVPLHKGTKDSVTWNRVINIFSTGSKKELFTSDSYKNERLVFFHFKGVDRLINIAVNPYGKLKEAHGMVMNRILTKILTSYKQLINTVIHRFCGVIS